jgi:3',5'-cyclic AMP phosphodiesterase CpdA
MSDANTTYSGAGLELSRRDLIMATAATATLAAAGAALAEPARPQAGDTIETAKGIVFETNGRGERGVGLAGVLVSNGREIVRTGLDGGYSLPIEPGMAIFVVKPAGYAAPLEPATRLPRYFYIHQPDGTPAELNLAFSGLAPTGPLPDSIDFGLIGTAEPKRFDVILLTDPQPESEAEVDYIRDDVVNDLIGSDAAFGITAGDLMFDDLSLYSRYNQIIAQIGLPWWNVGGNHDLNFESPGPRYSRETFKRVFGPNYYAFEHGDALFIMLDNVDYLGPDSSAPNGKGKYVGRIGERQLAFVANLLAETPAETLIVLVMHIPLETYIDPNSPSQNTADAAALLALLGDRPSVSFSGHTHTTEHHYLSHPEASADVPPHHHHVLTAVSGSWWSGPLDKRGIASADSRDGSPNGFHILSIDGTRYATRFVPASEPNGRQMRISLDGHFHREKEVYRDFRIGQLLGSPLPQDAVGATTLVVNFFDGGPKTKVEYTIGEGPARTMTKDVRPDPFIEELYGRNASSIKPWVKAEPSSHIWIARLPHVLAPGATAVKVRAVDEYGREHFDHLVLEVTA